MNKLYEPITDQQAQVQALALRLKKETQGEVLLDTPSRGRYATDASIYQALPLAVFIPKSAADIETAIHLAREHSIPILPRGGGTSQCGQTTGAALVIDNTKHIRQIVDLNLDQGYVDVEPGIVLDHLNAALKKHQVWFPVDVSTAAQATIGGMAGNNSCGSRSIAYGNMVHNVLGIEAWLASGQSHWFGPMSKAQGRPLEIGQFVADLATRLQPEIEEKWPKVMRRVAGYNLDIFNNQSERPYTSDGQVNLAHLLVGSEGSLSVYKKLRLKLAELPRHKTLGVVNFASFYDAMDSAQHIVKLGPCAVELVDRTMIDLSRNNPAFRSVIETALVNPQGKTPEAILLVEFAGSDLASLERKVKDLVALMSDLGQPDSVVEMLHPEMQKNLWEVRKAGLNIMMSLKGDGKPVSFIEDCAVPLPNLAEYTSALTEVFAKYGSRGTWYAHASVGTLHVRPILDMRRDGAQKMRAIAEEAAELVRRYKGAYSGEHGDGLCRGEWIEWQFGEHITKAFAQIKHYMDPSNLLNPGKIINPPRMDDARYFRFSPQYRVIPLQTSLDWSQWNVQNDPVTEETTAPGTGGDPALGFAKAVEMCNNNGHCRKFDAGTMCPSYRVTRDEKHLTRGRANTLRLALSNQLDRPGMDGFLAPEVKEAFDLCVSCKGCKRECPTGVDMAKMKIEYLSHYKKKHGWSLRDRAIAYLPKYSHWIADIPGLAHALNWRNQSPLLKKLGEKLLGFSAKRSLPSWRRDTIWRETLGCSLEKLLSSDKPVVLWADTFNGSFETENLRSAVRVLEAAGYCVHIPKKNNGHYCCGRTYLASGMVDQAKASAQELVQAFSTFSSRNIPVIGLEPSCILSLRDEFLVMGLGSPAEKLATVSQTFEEFLSREHEAGRFMPQLKPASQNFLLHGHCHQKSFDAVKPIIRLLQLIPEAKVQMIESSCCGMAGSFGYEAEHFDLSMQMAELNLLPAIRQAPDALLIADGSSCRHQIQDGVERQAWHVAQVLEKHLAH